MLDQLFNDAEQGLLSVTSAVQDFVYYHPAYFIIGMMFLYHTINWLFLSSVKKLFSKENCTNIVITGGAQGLGKDLAEQFVRRSQIGSVNLIIIDIRQDLQA